MTTNTFAGKYHPAIQYIFPIPGSQGLSPKTTIILRLEPTLGAPPTELNALIRASDQTGDIPAFNYLSTDGLSILFRPENDLREGDSIDVVIETSRFGYSDFKFRFYLISGHPIAGFDSIGKKIIPANQGIPISYPNLLFSNSEPFPNTRSAGTSAPIPRPLSPVRFINDVSVPSDFPKIRTVQTGETAPGYLFFATNYPQPWIGNYIIICDNAGTPVFYRRYPDFPRSGNFTLHPTGELSAYFYEDWLNIVLDSTFTEIDTIRCGHGYDTDAHELRRLENGHTLLFGRQVLPVDMSRIVEGGLSNARIEAYHLQEMDSNEDVIFEWRSVDFYSIEDSYSDLSLAYIDFVHLNSIAVDFDEHIIASARDMNEITKINRQTGEIIWRFGGRNNQFDFVNDTTQFFMQHDVRPVPGVPGHYTLFDNGRGRHPEYSRAVEYKLDTLDMTAERVWQFRHTPDYYAPWMGGAQRLPNGNTLIDWPDRNLRATEVTPEGKVVFELFSQDHSNYRCRRYEWSGFENAPYLVLENFGFIFRLIFNKSGDDDLEYYRIYASRENESWFLLDSTASTFLDVDVLLLENEIQYNFRTSAVDSEGRESDFSNIESAWVQYTKSGENSIRNGLFDSMENWILTVSEQAQTSSSIDSLGRLHLKIEQGGSSLEDLRLSQNNLLLLQKKVYTIVFDALASPARVLEVRLMSSNGSETDYSQIGLSYIPTDSTHFEYSFEKNPPNDTSAKLVFNFGQTTGDLWIDNVSLFYTDPVPADTDTVVSRTGIFKQKLTYRLEQNHPNPFNQNTVFSYFLPFENQATLRLYDCRGRKVRTLYSGVAKAGLNQVKWDGRDNTGNLVSTGIYIYTFKAGAFSSRRKCLFVK